jgi:ABC-2 type transport system permease protein
MKNSNKLKQNNLLSLLSFIVIVILVIYISNFVFFRLDLTSEKRYTLSDNTIKLLEENKEGIYIKIYLDGNDLPPGFKKLQRSIRELLDEFGVYSGNKLNYEFINPSENPDKDVRKQIYTDLNQKGILPIDLNDKDKEGKVSQQIIFPGAILIYKAKEVPINFLKNTKGQSAEQNLNNSIQSLEYEFTNALRKLMAEESQKIAFIQGHGELHEYELIDLTRTLSEYYEVQTGVLGGKIGILDPFKAIIIANPTKAFTEEDKFVIDQYIMNGGKVIWLLDGVNASMDSLATSPSSLAMATEYNLSDQLFKYGARVNPTLLMDLNCAPIGLTSKANANQGIELFPWLYFPEIRSDNKHFITKYLNSILTQFVSTVDTVGDSKKIKRTILLKSSTYAREAHVPARLSLEIIGKQPDPNAFNQPNLPIAVLLEGNFESLYKNRNISHLANHFPNFKTESKNTKLIIVGDGDIARNQVASNGEVFPLGYDRNTGIRYEGNKEFLLNAVNYLCGDSALMNLRLRELQLRILDKQRITSERTKWQVINVLIPIATILFFAAILLFIRKRKYTL